MLGIVVCLLVIGCSKNAVNDVASAQTKKVSIPANPEQALFDQVRAGAYQIGSAIDSIATVRKTVRDMAAKEKGATSQALLKIADQLDAAGKALSDFSEDPPALEQFKKDFAGQDDKRLKAIDACNDSLDDLNEAQDILSALLDSHPPEPENTQLTDADSALDECTQAVEGAINTMGGKVTNSDDSSGK